MHRSNNFGNRICHNNLQTSNIAKRTCHDTFTDYSGVYTAKCSLIQI